ncbi:MAG: hypothetical protein WDW38_004581 [Sanguina aurantia]
MDRLLAHCGKGSSDDRVMDSNTLEKERGITILSKYVSFMYKDHLINALDTPGHADFGGEVERVLGMVDGTVLLVDATEGPLAQTKFVLEKALKKGFKPIVVLNKVDRESATPERCGAVESQLFDLFASLGATDEQLDFTVLYASAKQGSSGVTAPGVGSKVLSSTGYRASQVEGLGKAAQVRVLHHDGRVSEDCKVLKVMKRVGQDKVYLDEAIAGDVVSIAGVPLAGIADTIASPLVGEVSGWGPGRAPYLAVPAVCVIEPISSRRAGVIMSLGLRKAELTEMLPIAAGKQRLTFVMPSRGMIGFKTVFVNITRGEGLMSRAFLRYDKHRGPMDLRGKGVLVCTAEGKATRDALGDLQQRGIFFIEPGADLYGGMVVGENTRDQDLDVNPSKKKVVSNVRCVEADEKIFLAAPRIMNLEDAIGYVAADELIEVTPSAVRLRKAILDPTLRKNHARKMQNQGR